jgi:hypothetical protein
MNRRGFIGILLSAAAFISACRPKQLICDFSKADALKNLGPLADPVLGKAASRIPELVVRARQALPGWQKVCKENIISYYRQRAAADFAGGKTVKLDGWLLSETEADIHALLFINGIEDKRPVDAPGP